MLTIMTQLQDVLAYSRTLYPNKTAIICDNKSYTYDNIDRSSNALANCLINMGVNRGDRVVVQLENSIESVIAFWAILKANAIVSIINPELKIEKIKYILNDSGAKCFIAHSLDNTLLDKTVIPSLNNIILCQSINPDSNTKVISFSQALKQYNSSISTANKNLDIDLASIIYTSGSTGEPKGVMLTHRNMLTALQSINSYLHNQSNDVIISALPFSFDYGLYQMLLAFFSGATLIVEQNLLWPAQLLRTIAREKATALPGVPTLFTLLYDHYKRSHFDLRSIRYVTNTGAALAEDHIKMLQSMFPMAQIFSMYGLTECKRCTYLPPKDIRRKPKSIGIAIPNTELWIIDENEQKVGPDQVGQLVIRGGTVMQGYWNDPIKSAFKLKDGLLAGEKILYTGDYCSLDTEGYLYYHGRMDEVIKSAGIKVSPKEVEDIIAVFPGVREVAVIGVEDAVLGSVLYAYVACGGKNITVSDLFDHCKQKLETKKVPKEIILLTAIPKTPNGKLDKQSLKVLRVI